MEVPLGRHLFLAHRASADHLDERLRAVGASLWMWLLLRHALQADGPSQRELADLMRIEAPTLVRHLDKLEEQGLVERRRDVRDRRIIRVYATPAGRARFEEFHAVVCRADDELRAALGERDSDTLSRVLAKVEGYYTGVDAGTGVPVPAVAPGGNGTTPTGSTTTGARTT
jgi:MarR family transcriptional regulator, transcriptional regulator for hemolysin